MNMYNYNTKSMGLPATYVYEDNYEYMFEPYEHQEHVTPPEPYDFHYPYFWPNYSEEWQKQWDAYNSWDDNSDGCHCDGKYYSKSLIEEMLNLIKSRQAKRDKQQDLERALMILNLNTVDSALNLSIHNLLTAMTQYISALELRDASQDLQMEQIALDKMDLIVNLIQEGDLVVNTLDGIKIWNEYEGD